MIALHQLKRFDWRGEMPVNKSYPLKNVRLEQLDLAGFNIADYICFPPRQLSPQKLKRFFDKYKKKNGISLRHFHADENRFFKCPVKYEVTDWKEALRFCQEHNEGFYTLCNEAIPLKDAIFGGNVLLLNELEFLVEYFRGPGSPRDTENKKLEHFTRSIGQKLPDGTPNELVQLGSHFRKFVPEERPIVIEFNIYPYPIGKKKSNIIIWEWRQGMLHETSEIVQALLTEIDKLNIENNLMRKLLSSATASNK